ncbi:MAG: ESX secretion-associated protein EspG [Mycobacteriaceae bacterium]|nr:ESX secretion-associated protein EspG [Mycobacteriaceae bacterium]
MSLSTSPLGVFVLQALLGVESMPVALRLKPFVPSAYPGLVVDTTDGPRPVTETAEYASLVAAGAISAQGEVDGAIRDWMKVLSRPERQVVLVARRPAAGRPDERQQYDDNPLIEERALVVCQHRRWLAMAARCGDEVVIGPVGESEDPDERASLTCQALLPAFGEAPPAAVEGVNLLSDALQTAVKNSYEHGREAVSTALSRLGLLPDQVDVLTAITRLDESAMAAVAIIDHGVRRYVHPRVFTVVDTQFGRVSVTYTTGADGRQWMSVFPTSAPSLRDDLADLLAAPRGAA